MPTLGSFSPAHERESPLANGVNGGSASQAFPQQQQDTSPSSRSFSAIVSPTAPPGTNRAVGEHGVNGAAGGKPFVYSREFLLSLYDEEKAKKRPIELAAHEVATRDLGGPGGSHKPWLLQEYREGEKELFSTTIHPANTRPSRVSRNDSTLSNSSAAANGSSATLDLSSLGTLPRDRDRALCSPSLRSPSIDKDGGILASAGRERRARERSSGGTMGIVGGVLGGIPGAAAATPTRKKDESVPGSKEGVWQGGRWRRSAQEAEEGEKRASAFGSRRFPLDEDESRRSSLSTGTGEAVPDTWDDGEGRTAVTGQPSAPPTTDALPSEPELTASVLGSLALDSDTLDDPLLAKPSSAVPSGATTPARAAPPPGLGNLPPAEVMWQYRDPSGQVQGPFSATMMHDWYRQQFFTPDLRVKRTSDADFESLENLVRRTGDSEKPFLAPKPSAPTSAFSSAPGTPQTASQWGAAATSRAQTPLEQLTAAVAQGRFAGGAANSPFGSASASPALQAQTLLQPFGQSAAQVDPWGAPLPAATGWTGLGSIAPQQQQVFQQQPQTPGSNLPLHSPVDLLRQLAAQQNGVPGQQSFGQAGLPADPFGRPSPLPSSPFFDPNQLVPGNATASPPSWLGQQLPQQQQLQQQHPWANATSPAAVAAAVASPLAQFAQPPAQQQQSVPAPIGPPAAAPEQPSSWDAAPRQAPEPVVEVTETVIVAEPVAPAAPATVAVVEEVEVAPAAPAKQAAKSPVVEAKMAVAPVEAAPEPSPSPAQSTSSKTPAAAPWAKEDVAASPVAAAPSPSLREIQEAEAREAAKRKEAARVQAAQASIQAAQRAAALEAQQAAESLPSSVNWAAGPAQVPAPKGNAAAPWSKPAAPSPVVAVKGQKTLKEIQEEEERRKKAQLAAQQQAGSPAAGKGYAGTTAQATPAPAGAAWTTVAVKPAVVRTAGPAASKGAIPGLPASPSTTAAARVASSVPVKPAAAVVRPAAPAAALASTPAKPAAVPRSVNVNGSASPATTVYDMENPPPPTPEFLAWTKQALKGLNVPLDEFIQMLLSFPLDASADVLEIISDSVYANSSTLDGRRFANDFATRRRNDVAVRYPSIFAKGAVRTAGKPTSMAAVLAATPQPAKQEWNVKVSTKNKKKGGK
ncbi:hypothetical protein Rhopal_000764-T1 [Rhodotorula paludigena]|uniref:GYF domain-containing protein n=1 Tax=Rhodotorula paludigena TaxID=86838 RepID=A0AAV5GD70_9BASI|nr:hypothetical protein Rhopal_000764-T1 [Rhodotorula paludigena]